jgi:hypothetical protein
MDSDRFKTRFETAVTAQGKSYQNSKKAILDMGQAAIPRLEAEIERGEHWKNVLTAKILLGWLTHEALYEECTNFMQGIWPQEGKAVPIGGKPGATARANMIHSQGTDVIPRVLEMLTKTREYTDQIEMGGIMGALRYFHDPETTPPVIEVLESEEEDEHIRVLAVGVLGEFSDDDRARESMLGILLDEESSDRLRGTAGITLSYLKESRALEPLVGIVMDGKNSQSLRLDSFLALGELGDERAIEPLHKSLAAERDQVLLQAIIGALARVGDRSSIRALETASEVHKDEDITEATEDAIEEINDRLVGR